MIVSADPMSSTVSTSQGFVPALGFGAYKFTNLGSSNPFGCTEPRNNDADDTELLSVSWNQDCSCFAAGTSSGFRIYNCDPFKETFRQVLKNGGFEIVEMLFRCNILALVVGLTPSTLQTKL